MIALPVMEHLSVDGYGLYPGSRSKPGLTIDLQPGLTLVLGANGLGKTTLVTLLYRMCTGPVELPSSSGELGGRRVTPRPLSRAERRMFANRVVDGGESAQASMAFTLRDARIETTRSLADLRLLRLVIDGTPLDAREAEFQAVVTRNSDLPAFSDWLLLLNHVTFYFEERRALVWDPSAQRQVLRLLFLPKAHASQWTRLEREILAKDSQMRNIQNVVGKEEQTLVSAETALGDADKVRDELRTLGKLQDVDQTKLTRLQDEIAGYAAQLQDARLDALRAELAHESAFRDMERRQLDAIASVFPSDDETTAYLLATLVSDSDCLVCGNHVPEVARAMRQRLEERACAVCGSPLEDQDAVKLFSPRAMARARRILQTTEERLHVAQAEREAIERGYTELLSSVERLQTTVTVRTARIDALVRQLPPAEAELHERRRDLATMRGRVDTMKNELLVARAEFSEFIQDVNRRVVQQTTAVQERFEYFASGFLLESCSLAWHPHRDRVGQSGEYINYPAYDLEMTGTDFRSPVRRSGPEQVSESQREFIDLAFRMTLMAVATEGSVGSLVIDAPESSLDAVFVSRAARVLTRFAKPTSGNRLLTTSNLVAGNLIPELIHLAGISSARDSRIVNLLNIAEPTAAIRRLKSEYTKVQRDLFAAARKL